MGCNFLFAFWRAVSLSSSDRQSAMSGLWLKLSRLPWQHHRLLPSELNLTALILAADCTWKRECKCAPPLMIFLFIFFNAPLKLFFLLILVFQNSMIPTGLSWEDLLHPLYQKYKNHITWGDQDLLNIIFHYNPGTSSFFKCVCVCLSVYIRNALIALCYVMFKA